MAKRLSIYKCEMCGNIVEVLHEGVGEMICCGQPMKLLVENTVDAAKEKHVPVIEKKGSGVLIKIGLVPHPMEEKHYIEWITVDKNASVFRKFLKPGEKPEAEFPVPIDGMLAREYCNLHGLWKA
jgi:superoxide reductase